MATAVLAALGALCAFYGLTVLATGSGTAFFAVWLALAAVLFGLAAATRLGLWGRLPKAALVGGGAVLGALLVLFVAVECLVATGFAQKGEPGLDYLVVLGAQVREDGPSTVLRYRLDAAYGYLAANEGTVCVVSGGQGPNEPWTEAQGMADYLVERGIDPARIVQEGASTSTVENLANSMGLMAAESGGAGLGDLRVGIVTNDFHVFRAVGIARHLGLEGACGIAAPSDPWYLPNNLLREFLGVAKDFLAGNL